MSNHKSAQSNKADTNDIDEILNMHRSETWSTGWNNDATEKAKQAIQNLIAQETNKARLDERKRMSYHVDKLNHYLEKDDILHTYEAMRDEYLMEIVDPHKRRYDELSR